MRKTGRIWAGVVAPISHQLQKGSLMREGASHFVIGPLVHANPKKLSRTSHMQGNLHMWSWLGFLRYLITMLLLTVGTPLLTLAHFFRNNPFRRDNLTYFCQILPFLSTAGTISMCFDSFGQERFDASKFIVSIPLPTHSTLFTIPAQDLISMYLAIEPQ
ncbi:hypothetical protein AMTRI_Chr06g173810 [Amborella trichopoda]